MGKFKTVLKLWVVISVVCQAMPAAAFFDNQFETEVKKEAGAVKLVREVLQGGYDVLTAHELKQMMDSGKKMVIVDSMPFDESYKKQHIPGAVQFLFPIPLMDKWDTDKTGGKSRQDFARLLGPDKNKIIVVYCGFVKCTRSHNAGLWAVRLGYKNVYRYPGGIFAWKGSDYPVQGSD